MSKRGERLPGGFGGSRRSFSELLPQAHRPLRLPGDLPPAEPKPLLGLPDGPFDLIAVDSLTESMGRIEDALQAMSARLCNGGDLVADFENRQSLRQLRIALEGRPGAGDCADSLEDPGQALVLRRVLQAAAAAGLRTLDAIAVPGFEQSAPELAGALAQQGFLASAWLRGAPPARYWLRCRKQQPLRGSVLIGQGTGAEQERTAAALAAFLPEGWEVLRCQGADERSAWNRAVVDARGEFVWFLRAGAAPGEDLFANLTAAAELGPAAPGSGAGPACPGDVSGLMLSRLDLLVAGPLPEDWRNDRIALEEWNLELGCCAPAVQMAAGSFASPEALAQAPECFVEEGEALVARWRPVPDAHAAGPTLGASRRGRTEPPPWQGREPRVSLCMIARDEEQRLPRCLEAARAAADEIVLVDTGSKDRTVAIAESFGARVLRRAWDDDFSAPRNAALAAATGDWILVLDADEVLADGAAARIRELVRDPGVAGFHVRVVNDYGNGRTLGVLMVRLFRNLPGVAYRNRIHEQVTPSLLQLGTRLGLAIASSDVEVVHYGYSDRVVAERGKDERNERLFLLQLAEDPDDIYTLYKYGDFLRRMPSRQDEALQLLESCLERILSGPPSLPAGLPYAGEVAALCALGHARAERLDRAREIVATALRRFRPTPNLHYLAASLDLAAGRSDDAIAQFRRCLAFRGLVLVVPVQEGITGHVALAGIAQALLQKGDLERSRQMLERAIAMQPGHEASHLALSRLHLVRGDAGAALRVLTEFLAACPDSAGACQQTTLILQRLGLKDQARRMGTKALSLLETGAQGQDAERMRKILATLG